MTRAMIVPSFLQRFYFCISLCYFVGGECQKDLFLPDWHAFNPGRVHIVEPEEEVHPFDFPVRLY
ncbi:MAG: hypothetical protein LKE88_12720 [Acidaminococcus provencensis]|uniref:hypothetical protein n=1 Tax=Acidaminococcus provencensis TaxID=2058289 RepID=UPI0023F0DCD3|nr:hypothetical protein [Acidaminococcus provencensis]MCH4097469.1 hypothetical protein [Acidaminococcus provencensis]